VLSKVGIVAAVVLLLGVDVLLLKVDDPDFPGLVALVVWVVFITGDTVVSSSS
jgi:hypothetical protein